MPATYRFYSLLTTIVVCSAVAQAATPIGILGGENSGAYAELLEDTTGGTVPISNIPTGFSSIASVKINSLGVSLVGGQNVFEPYTAFVDASGVASDPISLGILTGTISSVSINDSGLGLVGGKDIGGNVGFAAQVFSDGTVVPLSTGTYIIESVAVNSSGLGLIGGEGGSAESYAAYVSSDGTVSPSLVTASYSRIYAVDINQDGVGVIAGRSIDLNAGYGAFVYPDQTVVPFNDLPTGGYPRFTCASINASIVGVVGGTSDNSDIYIAKVSSDGNMTFLDVGFTHGRMNSVSINDSNLGIMGGYNSDTGEAYAGLIRSDNTVVNLFSTPLLGEIYSVDINAAGVGLIGGTIDSVGYAALVAPNGTVTPLSTAFNGISSVSLGDVPLNDSVVPASAGTYMVPMYSQVAATHALENRFIQQNRVWSKEQKKSSGSVSCLGLDDTQFEASLAASPKFRAEAKPLSTVSKRNTIWVEPFGNFLYAQKSGSLPGFSNETGGVLLGYERQDSSYLFGLTVGYAYNYAHLSEHAGKVKLQEEMLSFYGAYYTEHFWFDMALWGGLYQARTTRYFDPSLSAEGKPDGYLLDPHVELATPWALSASHNYVIEPFVQLDWINNWQDHYTEKGASGFNLVVPHKYNSMLASEGGLRFYEKFSYGWGAICLEEKISYINQTVFGSTSAAVSFIDSPSVFPVAIASGKTQNLGAAQILANFVPKDGAYPYGGCSFQGSFGSGYQSYFVSLFLGQDF